jgi:hypothetical protein
MSNPTLGVVGQADLINATGLPIASGVAGLGAGVATFLGTPSSANLRTAVTDETGSGSLVFANAPVLVAPNLGTPTFLVATNATGTAVGLTAGSAITNANLTGAVTSVGNATSLGSFTSAQLRTALTDETGAGSAVFATSPTITAPILNQINDTNNAQILGLSPTTSAVDYLVAKNGIGVGVPLHLYADGASANIGLHIQPKGTGLVTISDGTDFNKGIRFRSSGSAASAVTLLDAVSTAGRVVTLPDATTTLVGRDTTDTLTNKTIAFSSNTFSGTLAIANGGTNASTAASAIENLLPAYTGNGSKGLRLNSGATALEWIADGGGTVTSVAATVPSFLSIAGSPITTSGTLAFTLSGTALPTTSGGTNLTSFTSGGVVYASSSSALATGSALQFDGTGTLTIGGAGSRLTVQSTTGTNNSLIKFSNTGGDAYIGLDNSGGGLGAPYALQLYHEGNYPIVFSTNNTERMRLTSSSLYTASGISLIIGGTSVIDSSKVQFYGAKTISDGIPQQQLNIADTSAIATGAGGAISFSALFSGSSYTTMGSIEGVRENGTSGNYAGALVLKTRANGGNNNEVARFTSTGNLGLGVAPSAWGSDYKAIQLGGGSVSSYSDNNYLELRQNSYYSSGYKYVNTGFASGYTQTAGRHEWSSAPSGTAGNAISFTQAMTLDASGNLLVGTTSQISAGKLCLLIDPSNNSGLAMKPTADNYDAIRFLNASSSQVGGVSCTSSATSYNTSSDYRLKNITGPITTSGAYIDSLNPVEGTWKADGSTFVGLIAHEAQEASRTTVATGTKDGADMQSMDYSNPELIANLIAELQSLRQRLSAANL